MTLLVACALRSLLLGLLVWAVLKLARVRDTGTETIVWTFVLIVALAMPLLSHYLPRLVVTVPHLSAGPPLAADPQLPGAHRSQPTLFWFGRHGQLLLLSVYVGGLLLCLTRLLTGMVLTLRLYRCSVPVGEDWARGRRIRASASLKSPASLAQTILLPADFPSWSVEKRQAVLAHEAAHIARSDFLVQLAASVHCALFWFSPFAWWLRSKLAAVAESASDEAAARRLNDPLRYAEILLEVARGARSAPLIVAMAKAPLIQQRIDRLLSGAPDPNPSLFSRVIIMSALTLAALTVASARAAVGQDSASASAPQPVHVKIATRPSATTTRSHSNPAAVRSREHLRRLAPVDHEGVATPQTQDEVSYNPRALLDPVYTASRPVVPASTVEHAGKTFYIRSTERVVAEVAAADRTYRPAQ
jgi:beta-lactamase regulating signal transducer with metallopeptidase domain